MNSPGTDGGGPPGAAPAAFLHVPAEITYLGVVRYLTEACAQDGGLAVEALDEVRLAVDVLAALLIGHADVATMLEVQLQQDEDDLYIRLSVRRHEAGLPVVVPELSQRLLVAAAGSYAIDGDGGQLFGVLQRSLSPPA